MRPRFAGILLAAVLATAPLAAKDLTAKVLSFQELDGWVSDNHAEALSVFTSTCTQIDGFEWPQLCQLASRGPDARAFFELFFRPVEMIDGNPALFTGYYEPEIRGSRFRSPGFDVPVYRLPEGGTTLTRAQIADGGLAGRGLEIAWVADPVELFFLQIQGSGRIRLNDGGVIRLGFAGHNGHPYRSLGETLVRWGVYDPHQISAKVIGNWVSRNPVDGVELLNSSPSYVFFREIRTLSSSTGPIGAMSKPITPLRSIAVDPTMVPLGAPVWIEKNGQAKLERLMIAQDVGSAIKGAQRADIFYGTGDTAGDVARQVKDGGRLVMLLPIQLAYSLEERLAQ